MRAVTFADYGDVNVLKVADVPAPVPGAGQLLVQVRAASANPMDWKIRRGLAKEHFPVELPAQQGNDVAGVVTALGPDVSGFAIGDEVLGAATGAAQAELSLAPAALTIKRPAGLTWEVAGSLFVAGTTAYAMVEAVQVEAGDNVLVAGATGGVGTVAAQLAHLRGARVIGVASDHNAGWLSAHGIEHVAYGDGLQERIEVLAGTGGISAALDCYGAPNVEVAIGLGVAPERIDTIADFAAPQRWPGVQAVGSAKAARPEVLIELVDLILDGKLELPISATYPLDQVVQAYTQLEQQHPLGKVVLMP